MLLWFCRFYARLPDQSSTEGDASPGRTLANPQVNKLGRGFVFTVRWCSHWGVCVCVWRIGKKGWQMLMLLNDNVQYNLLVCSNRLGRYHSTSLKTSRWLYSQTHSGFVRLIVQQQQQNSVCFLTDDWFTKHLKIQFSLTILSWMFHLEFKFEIFQD